MKLAVVNRVLDVLLLRQRTGQVNPKFACYDCGFAPDNFMVHDELWQSSGLPKRAFSCIHCLERRLGRRLTVYDFTPHCQINRLLFIGYKLALQDERNQVEQKEALAPTLAARGWEPAHVPAPPRPVSKSPNWDVV